MIRFIPAEDVLSIRKEVLRKNALTLDECRFSTDITDGAFHLGYFDNGQLACIASFHPQKYGEYKGVAYQLRGMATIDEHRGKGIGNQLINFAIVYLRGQKVNYLWCNARAKAIPFYRNVGFEVISDEFELHGIGPHRVLYLKIQ
jgi:predicted GNAT family N-acyltransferase